MFDIGWSELLIIGIVALIVIGPKELPGALRALGQWTAKIRRMASEFQSQFHEAMREAELHELKKEVDEMTAKAQSYAHFDPVDDIRKDIENAVGPPPSLDTPATQTATTPATDTPAASTPTAEAAAPEPPPASSSAPSAAEPAHAAEAPSAPTEAAVPDAPKSDPPKSDPSKPDLPKPDLPKPDAGRAA